MLKRTPTWMWRLFALVVLASFLMLLYRSGLYEKMSCSWLYEHNHELKTAVQASYARWALLYTASMLGVVALSLPVVIPVVIAGGYLFGLVEGALYAVIGTIIGSLAPFFLVRHFGGTYIKERYGKRFAKFNQNIERYGVNYILVLHYLAVVPFFIINTCAALTNMSLCTFIRVTALGTFPVYLIYAFAGRELSEVCSLGNVMSAPVIFAMILLVALALIPMLVQKVKGPLLDS